MSESWGQDLEPSEPKPLGQVHTRLPATRRRASGPTWWRSLHCRRFTSNQGSVKETAGADKEHDS